MLKPILDSLDSIPEALRSEYEAVDGKYHLSVELADGTPWKPVAKLVNTVAAIRAEKDTAVRERAALKTERDALATERDGFKTKVTELEAKGGPDDPAFKQFQAASEQRIAALEKANGEEKAAREKAERDSAERQFVNDFRAAAQPFVREDPGALEMFTDKFRQQFHLQDGKWIPKDGETVLYSEKNPGQPMDVKEFIASRAAKDPNATFLLRQSRGAGATGSNGTPSGIASQFTVQRGAPFDVYQAAKAAAEKAGQPLQVVDQ